MTRYSSSMRDILMQIREGYSPKEIKMAIGIASDPRYKGGNMTGAVKAIEKIKRGLADHPQVAAVLKRQNEDIQEEPASPDEGSMAVQQLEFMMHAVERTKMHIQSGGEFPEWMQNKLSGAHEKMKGLYANIEHGDMNEEVALDEKVEYVEYKFRNRNDAMKAKQYFDGIQLMSFDINDDDITNGELGVDAGNKDMTKYHNEVMKKFRPKVLTQEELEEGAMSKINQAGKDLARYAAKDKKDLDYKDYMKAAALMTKGKLDDVVKFTMDLDTEPRDVIIQQVKDALGKDATEKLFKVSIREAKEVLSRFRDDKLKQNTINLAKQKGLKVKDMGDKIEVSGNGRKVMDLTLAVQKQDVKIEELEEGKSSTGYELYHKDFSSAMKHAYDFAKKKFGIEVDPKEIDDKVASGPRKPSKGKTNSYRLMGKDGKKAIQVQVYGMDNGKYELNMYKESVELEEKLKVSDGLGAWIDDFKKSDAPQFQGKSDEEKKNMAIAAFTDAGGKLDEMREPYAVVDTADGNKVVGTASDEKGAKSIITTSQLPPMKIKDKKTLKIVKVKKKQMIGQPIKEEEEPQKPDSAKEVEQGREDKKKTRIAQLQLQIAKAQETINKLNAQENNNA